MLESILSFSYQKGARTFLCVKPPNSMSSKKTSIELLPPPKDRQLRRLLCRAR